MRGTDVGTFQIRNEVIGTIASLAAREVQGVLDVWRGSLGFLPWRPHAGIQVESKDQEIRLRLSLVVEYGVDLSNLAVDVQTKVREAIERMTHLAVGEVEVQIHHVQPKRSSF